MKRDADFEIAVCEGSGETHDVSNYFPVWLPVIGSDCKNIFLDGVSSLFLWAFLIFFFLTSNSSNNSVQLAFECITYSFILTKLLQSLPVQQPLCHQNISQYSILRKQISSSLPIQLFCIVKLSHCYRSTRLKFIGRKFMT